MSLSLFLALILAGGPISRQELLVIAWPTATGQRGSTEVQFRLLSHVLAPSSHPSPTPRPPEYASPSRTVITLQLLRGSAVVCTFPIQPHMFQAWTPYEYKGREYLSIGSTLTPLRAPCKAPPGTYRLGAVSSEGSWTPSEPFALRQAPISPKGKAAA